MDRVSKLEGMEGLPADYSKLPAKVPELGPPLPGDLGPAIVKLQQPVTPTYALPGHGPAYGGAVCRWCGTDSSSPAAMACRTA